MTFIANARMYAVTPEAEAAWQRLLSHICSEAGVALDYVPYPAPQPLEHLWRRPDLGAALMCGYPIALRIADVVPIAAPIPRAEWARGHSVYRTDLIVRAESPYRTLADTFGGTAGWTVEHSHSGFNAFRHHLRMFRTSERPKLYDKMVGNLVTARRILDCVRDGTIDVGPLDAYWHMLIARYRPDLTTGIRVLETTDLAPMPAFVAAPAVPAADVARLRAAFVAAKTQTWFPALADKLLLNGFAAADQESFAQTLAWDHEARSAGYPLPA